MMKHFPRAGALFAAALMTAPLAAQAQPDQDAMFVRRAAHSGIAEVRQGQVARLTSHDPEVIRFGERMDVDHSAANARLAQICRLEQRPIVTDEGQRNNGVLATLQRLRGREFDRQYMQLQVTEHQQAVSLFETEASSGQDPRLVEFARRTLPTLREHLRMAQRIWDRIQGM